MRLYYTDSMLRAFEATVLACEVLNGRPHVVLDQTAFYPSSGGQPCDTGRLGGTQVLEVFDRDDGQIAHVTSAPLEAGAVVAGEIDWGRRFDHMQQHTGQHVLSAAFDRRLDVRTVSFHMGTDVSTIDLARDVSIQEIAQVEAAANAVVWSDRPVSVRFVSAEEASRLPLRKESARAGELRLVDVADFDLSACGGTHVPRTGMVGLIAISGWERVKGATRVGFVCGGRALAAHGALRDVVLGATRALSVVPPALGDAIYRQQQDLKDAQKRVGQLETALAQLRGVALRAAAETIGPLRVVLSQDEGEAPVLKTLAATIVEAPGLVAAIAGTGQPVPIVIARSRDVALDAHAVLRQLTQAMGGRGGGRPELAQGGVPGTADEVLAAIRRLVLP